MLTLVLAIYPRWLGSGPWVLWWKELSSSFWHCAGRNGSADGWAEGGGILGGGGKDFFMWVLVWSLTFFLLSVPVSVA